MTFRKVLLVSTAIIYSTTLFVESSLATGHDAPSQITLTQAAKTAGAPVKIQADKVIITAGTGSVKAPNAKAANIFRDYLKAIGGMEVLNKVKSLYMVSGMQVQGMDFEIEMKAMAPYLEVMTMSAGGNIVMKSKFDGTAGFTEFSGNKTHLTEEEIKAKTSLTGLVEQLDYLKKPGIYTRSDGSC